MPWNPLNELKFWRGLRLMREDEQTVLFVTSLLRAREIKMASALRGAGWKVVLIYLETTPFAPESYFDIAIRAESEEEAHSYAKALYPKICHIFSGAVDDLLLRFCRDKPGPLVVDLNDIFCQSLFDYCHERFEKTRECLENATALCSRDLQAKYAARVDGFKLPFYKLFFPEYTWRGDEQSKLETRSKGNPDEVRVVSVGTFCLETLGMYDSAHLQLAKMLTEQRIHLHIYPHWFYRKSSGSSFNKDLKKDFADFFQLQERTDYLHIHESLPLDELARELPQYDFGLISGGCPEFGQRLEYLKPDYMKSCFSGRIADYLDARLPVLINREVRFNYLLLKHYGLSVDLGGLLRPRFREKLLSIKRDQELEARVKAAAQTLSLNRNVVRLTNFYKLISEDNRRFRVVSGFMWTVAGRIPFLGKAIHEIRRGNLMIGQLARELESKKKESQHYRKRFSAATDKMKSVESVLQRIKKTEEWKNVASVGLRLRIERGSNWQDEVSALLNWPEIVDDVERKNGFPELMEMMRLFNAGSGPLHQTSMCWDLLNYKNLNQLLRDGYKNFKRTIGCNYFNFLVQNGEPQLACLESMIDPDEQSHFRNVAAILPDDPYFDWHDQLTYRYFVLLLWRYVQKMDVMKYLDRLQEPEEGNPLLVPFDGQWASQDLANSVLEYYSMEEFVDFTKCKRVMEIGGGYGRNAYVILKLNPEVQYTLVDIPPALFVAQRYLSAVFRDRKIFHVRDFQSYDDVKDEMEQASIVCLLPQQLELLSDRRFDLGINISSFGEMNLDQIKVYFNALGRLLKDAFYMKQWKVSQNAFDQLNFTENDYPVSKNWEKVYSRTCQVQTGFFEACYRVK